MPPKRRVSPKGRILKRLPFASTAFPTSSNLSENVLILSAYICLRTAILFICFFPRFFVSLLACECGDALALGALLVPP